MILLNSLNALRSAEVSVHEARLLFPKVQRFALSIVLHRLDLKPLRDDLLESFLDLSLLGFELLCVFSFCFVELHNGSVYLGLVYSCSVNVQRVEVDSWCEVL